MQEDGPRLTQRNLFSLRAGVGFAHVAVGDLPTAIQDFRDAHSADPKWPSAQAILAIAELLEGKRDVAFERAKHVLSIDQTSYHAAAVIMDTAPADLGLAELDALIPTGLQERIETHLPRRNTRYQARKGRSSERRILLSPLARTEARALREKFGDARLGETASALRLEAAAGLGSLPAELDAVLAASPGSIVLRSVAIGLLSEADPRRDALVAEIDGLVAQITNIQDRFHAAEALFAANQYSKAADLYASLHGTDKDDIALRRHLCSLRKQPQSRAYGPKPRHRPLAKA